jgi:hypothetical protein
MHLLCKYVCKNKQFIYFVIQKVVFFIIMNEKMNLLVEIW